jgi:ATP/maltotriose-dependent transcriptional regulator MalT
VRIVTARPPAGPSSRPTLGQALAAETHGRSDPPAVVVVDDAHLLTAAELALVVETVDRGTGSPHLVLATRRDLALPLVSLKLRDEVTEIRADQLLFRDDEATALITAHAPGSSELDRQTVLDRGRGWAAALVLGARAVSGAADPVAARYALSVTEQPVLDYLLGEVFDTLDARICHVLLCTCATDEVSAADVVAMSADPDAVALLSRLAAEGMLVAASSSGTPSGDGPTTFTYHPLLVELLRRRVMTGTPDHELYAAAQVRIVQHHMNHGDPAGALRYAARLDDHRWLIQLLCQHGPGLLAWGELDVVRAALAQVPSRLEREDPELVAVRALERRIAGDVPGAMRLAAEAIVGADASGDGGTDTTVILRCWLARIGAGSTMEAVAKGRERLGCADLKGSVHHHADPDVADATEAVRGWLLSEVAVCEIWLGDLTSARLHIDAAMTTALAMNGKGLSVARALVHVSVIDSAEGLSTAAERHARQALDLARAGGAEDASVFNRAHVVLCWNALQRVDLEEAQRELVIVRRGLERAHDTLVEVAEHLITGYLLVHSGQVAAAQAWLESFPAATEPLPAFVQAHLAVLRAWCALASGDLPAVAEEVETLLALDLRAPADFIRGVALDLGGDTPGSFATMRDVTEQRGQQAAALPAAVTASVYQAWILLREGRSELARSQLNDVLSRMTPHQRLYVAGLTSQPGMVELVGDLSWQEQAPEPQARVIDLRDPVPVRALPSQRADEADITIQLTAREADVLQQLALGGSYADIAETLYITENTVKTHLASLYRKLGATRRSDALRAARRAGLLAG